MKEVATEQKAWGDEAISGGGELFSYRHVTNFEKERGEKMSNIL